MALSLKDKGDINAELIDGIDSSEFLISTGWNSLPAVQYEETLVLRITASGDFTGTYAVGDRIKLTQDATEKQFIVDDLSYATSYTYFALNGNGTTLSANAITNPYYSHVYSPAGFDNAVTKNQVLNEIKDMDGKGSGIDADLIDGKHLADILLAVYPVGAIYISVSSTSPATLFGGTWASFGAGRVLVGIDSGNTSFDTAEETGGNLTHTHTLSSAGSAQITTASDGIRIKRTSRTFTPNRRYSVTGQTEAGFTTETSVQAALDGATDSGSTIPPYIVVYMWKRTA